MEKIFNQQTTKKVEADCRAAYEKRFGVDSHNKTIRSYEPRELAKYYADNLKFWKERQLMHGHKIVRMNGEQVTNNAYCGNMYLELMEVVHSKDKYLQDLINEELEK